MSLRIGFIRVILLATLPTITHAQDSLAYSTVSLAFGVNAISNKDQFQSPYTYKGTNLFVSSNYTRFRIRGQHVVDVTFSGGQVESIVSPKADNQLLLLYYDYLFNLKVKTSNTKFTPSLGIGLHTILSNTNYVPSVESSSSYLSGGAYFALSGKLLYQVNQKSNLRMQFGLPVFGLVYRPDFEINGKALTQTTVIGKSYFFSVKLEYDCKLTPKLNLTAAYNYSYFAFDEPRPITILQNGLLIGLRRKF